MSRTLMEEPFGASTEVLSANKAVAYAVRDVDVDVVAAYPITPQTAVVEEIARMVADGELEAEYVHVESEHSAISVLAGASAVGARVFTATSSQGLALMHEVLHIVSGLRLPVVMAVATRALSAPISIWNDHSDIMNARDAGWVIYFVSNAQEAYDTVVQAYRLAEDPDVLLPVMVAYDGFLVSHASEPVRVEGRRAISFAPKRWRGLLLGGEPLSVGTLATPDFYYEFKYQQVVAMRNALRVSERVDADFGREFGRSYGLFEAYMLDDAEVALLVTSSLWSPLKRAVERARREGIRAGGVRLRLYRPLPRDGLVKAVSGLRILGVVDRAIGYGLPVAGPLATEITVNVALQAEVMVKSIVAGIGQRSLTHGDLLAMLRYLDKVKGRREEVRDTLFYGVRGGEAP